MKASPPPAEMTHDRVLVKRLEPEKMLNGIHIVSNDKSNEGLVIAVGPGAWDPDAPNFRAPMAVKPGDHVLFGQYAGFEWSYLGERYLVCREADICLVLKDRAKE